MNFTRHLFVLLAALLLLCGSQDDWKYPTSCWESLVGKLEGSRKKKVKKYLPNQPIRLDLSLIADKLKIETGMV